MHVYCWYEHLLQVHTQPPGLITLQFYTTVSGLNLSKVYKSPLDFLAMPEKAA